MADFQRVLPDYDPLDQQLQDSLSIRECRLVEPGPHSQAERLQVRPDRLRRLALGLQLLLLVTLGDENMTSALDLFATGLQLGQVEHPGLIGVDQALLLPVETLELNLPPLDRGMALVPRLREPRQFLEPCGQRAGILEQRLDVPPDGRVELLDLGRGLGTAAGPVPGHGVLSVTFVIPIGLLPRPAVRRDPVHRQAARLAGQQAAQQVVVVGIVAERQERVAGELVTRALMRRLVD
jgi:hypothetical protein